MATAITSHRRDLPPGTPRSSSHGRGLSPGTGARRAKPPAEDPPPQPEHQEVYSVLDHIKRHRKPMSVAELAPILGVSEDVLYRMVRDGKIPQLIVPGRRVTRFDPASIVYWLRKHNPLLNQVQKAS